MGGRTGGITLRGPRGPKNVFFRALPEEVIRAMTERKHFFTGGVPLALVVALDKDMGFKYLIVVKCSLNVQEKTPIWGVRKKV